MVVGRFSIPLQPAGPVNVILSGIVTTIGIVFDVENVALNPLVIVTLFPVTRLDV